MITDAVCTYLLTQTAITDLVGSRVYQLKLPQQPTWPALLVWLVTDPATYHARGVDGFGVATVQVDSFAQEYDAVRPDPLATAHLLADAVDAALSGIPFDSPADWIHVQWSKRTDRKDIYEPDELRLTHIALEYEITYRKIVSGRARPRHVLDLKTAEGSRKYATARHA